jgi:radical SAM protein with 4Fe4S-binding SPASM domain
MSASGSLGQLVRKTWEQNLLFSVLVELTYRCNLDCSFCYNDVGLRGKPLTTEQYLDFFSDLRDMQVLNLTLTGGEPLAHPDFLRVGAHARELGFVVRIKSNGHALRGTIARRIRDEIDPFLIEVSLHGATAATHDRQTRVPGSFARLLENIAAARELGLRLKINSTLTRWNEDEVEDMLDLADSLGVMLQIDPEVTARDNGDRSPLDLSASPAGTRRLFAALRERQQRLELLTEPSTAPRVEVARGADDGAAPTPSGKHCGAGSSGIAVDPYGNVYPCVQWRRPCGNLHQNRIAEIWVASKTLTDVRELTVAARSAVAAHGADAHLLNFCPGNAEALTGNPLAIYPASVERLTLARDAFSDNSETVAPTPRRRALLPVIAS